jgi:hypothetical protein
METLLIFLVLAAAIFAAWRLRVPGQRAAQPEPLPRRVGEKRQEPPPRVRLTDQQIAMGF